MKIYTFILLGLQFALVNCTSDDYSEFKQNQEIQSPIFDEKLLTLENNSEDADLSTSKEQRKVSVEYFAYTNENAKFNIVLVGGTHGGYEFNTVDLSYELLDYFSSNPKVIPQDINLHIIPSFNPTGLQRTIDEIEGHTFQANGRPDFSALRSLSFWKTLTGRTNNNIDNGVSNAIGVDLNRNWGCNWKKEAQWYFSNRDPFVTVSGGKEPFSESETKILKKFLEDLKPQVVIFYHSQAKMIYLPYCVDNDVATNSPYSKEIAQVYKDGTNNFYGLHDYEQNSTSGFSYNITGDVSDWLITQEFNVATFTVELANKKDTDFEVNKSALLKMFDYLIAE